LPENELFAQTQCKAITKTSVLYNVYNLSPAEGALKHNKMAQFLKRGIVWLAMWV